MPIHNEENYIAESLGAVLSQDYPLDDMEILVVDGQSTDRTREIVREIATGHNNVRLLDNPGKIVPVGMNIGLRQAQGDFVVRVDGHCVIAPDYVRLCVERLQADSIDGIGGPMETIGETELADVIALAMSSPFGVGGSAFRTVKDREMEVETVPFPAYRMSTIRRIGLYDEEMVRNQDDEYNYRLLKSGGKILLSPQIRSRYYSRSSLKRLWKQYFQYGFWKVRVLQKHPRQLRLRQFAPPLFVAALAGSALLAPFRMGRSLLALVTGLYLLANVGASLRTASKTEWRYLPILPVIFGILHISYGSGFLAGLVKFARFWKPSAASTVKGASQV
jgi:glycosyltransferase involved in cell wall biosynthesis